MRVSVIGAGVAGLTVALELTKNGIAVDVLERGTRLGLFACSTLAGGLISPWCEHEALEPAVTQMGVTSLQWWQDNYPGLVQKGSLVIAPQRDLGELTRFAARTKQYRWLTQRELAMIEPDLGDHFAKALFFPEEAHLDPRAALSFLADEIKKNGGNIRFGVNAKPQDIAAEYVIDCRGLAARDTQKNLRGVRGEMLVVKSAHIKIERPVRMLHPRFPLYIVPRGEGVYMLGATTIESESKGRITTRSAVELLNAAYTLHPAFAEAEIVEMGADLRPAYPNNVPSLSVEGRIFSINGLYRHGFLAAPALAQMAVKMICGEARTKYADLNQRELG